MVVWLSGLTSHWSSLDLCLTANLVQLVSRLKSLDGEPLVRLVTTLSQLLSALGQYVTARQSPLSHWHPVLGWFSVSLDRHLQASLGLVRTQLARLWSPECLVVITSHLHGTVHQGNDHGPELGNGAYHSPHVCSSGLTAL